MRLKASLPPCAVQCCDAIRAAVGHLVFENYAFVDVHHIVPRSEGGRHDAGNLITMCGAHHRALHRGALAVERVGSAVRFRHADGSVYGGVANPTILHTVGKVSSALRNMGFREGEVRRALAEVRERAELEQASAQDWLRAALARLVPVTRWKPER